MKVYFIKEHPELSHPILLDISYLREGAFSFFSEDMEIKETGDFKEIDALKTYLKEADSIYLLEKMDQSSFFELGVCQALGKTVTIIDDGLAFESMKLELGMSIRLEVITIEEFVANLINE